jgi:hypothetical protein
MCRIQTVFEDGDSLNAFLEAAFKGSARLTTGATYASGLGTDAHGRITIVTYVAPDGEPLPDIVAM